MARSSLSVANPMWAKGESSGQQCPFFLKRSSQGVGDHPDPLNDQDDATTKAIIFGHLQMHLATN